MTPGRTAILAVIGCFALTGAIAGGTMIYRNSYYQPVEARVTAATERCFLEWREQNEDISRRNHTVRGPETDCQTATASRRSFQSVKHVYYLDVDYKDPTSGAPLSGKKKASSKAAVGDTITIHIGKSDPTAIW